MVRLLAFISIIFLLHTSASAGDIVKPNYKIHFSAEYIFAVNDYSNGFGFSVGAGKHISEFNEISLRSSYGSLKETIFQEPDPNISMFEFLLCFTAQLPGKRTRPIIPYVQVGVGYGIYTLLPDYRAMTTLMFGGGLNFRLSRNSLLSVFVNRQGGTGYEPGGESVTGNSPVAWRSGIEVIYDLPKVY